MTTDAEYLSQYDASRFPSPLVTVDSVLFTLHEGALCVLLVERANPPQQGAWGYPAGLSTRRTMIQPAPRRYVSSRKNRDFTAMAGATRHLFRAGSRSARLEPDYRLVCVNLVGRLSAAYRQRQRCPLGAR